jgi:hypothetical protein
MPQLSSSLSMPDGLPGANAADLGQWAGLSIQVTQASWTTPTTGHLAKEVANPLLPDGATIKFTGEPPGVTRVYDATSHHARKVLFPGGATYTLATDTAAVIATTGVPAGGIGAVNDVAYDQAAGLRYVKTGASTWGAGVSVGGGASTPTHASSVPSLSAAHVMLDDNTYLTGTEVAQLLAIGRPAEVVSPSSISKSFGESVNIQLLANGAPTSYAATGLPAGWTLNTSTGVITGSATTTGAFAPVFSAANAQGSGYLEASVTITGLVYNFALGTLPSGVTATGGTGGRVTNASGVTTAATAPRFDYSGASSPCLLIEPATTNLLATPTDILSASWPQNTSGMPATTFTATGAPSTSPDYQAFTVVVPAAVTGAISARQQLVTGLTPGQSYTFGVELKGDTGGEQFYIGVQQGGSPYSYLGNQLCTLTTGYKKYSTTFVADATSVYVGVGPNQTAAGQVITPPASLKLKNLTLEAGTKATTFALTSRTADAVTVTLPAGLTYLEFTFDDNSTQEVSGTAGAFAVNPTALAKSRVKKITLNAQSSFL